MKNKFSQFTESELLRATGRCTRICPISQVKKRVVGFIFTLVFACSLAFTPLLAQGDNKVSALSTPTQSTDNVHSSFLSSSLITVNGLSSNLSLAQGNGRYSEKGDIWQGYEYMGAVTPYTSKSQTNRYIATSVDSFVTKYALENRYYDNGYSDYFMTQNYGNPLDYFTAVYRAYDLSITNEITDIIYIPNEEYLANIKLWYAIPHANISTVSNHIDFTSKTIPSNLLQSFARGKGDNPSEPYSYSEYADSDLNNGYVPTRAILTLSFEIMNAKGENVPYELTAYTYDNGINGGDYFTHAYASFDSDENRSIIHNALQSSVQFKNCYLINNLKLSCRVESAVFDYNYIDGDYLGFYSESEGSKFSGWTFDSATPIDSATFGTMYLKIPLYEQNIYAVNTILYDANRLYLEPWWNADQSIFGFFSKFLNMELIPNFKLSYMLTLAFGITLITIFVRMFR